MIDEKKLIYWIKCNCNPYGKPTLDYETSIKIIDFIEKQQQKVGEWIPVSEHLPEDLDNRFYMCIVENHEDDLPMFLQYDDELGFGYWADHFHPQTLGYLGDEFITTEDLEYEKVVAWMPLPNPYRGKEV